MVGRGKGREREAGHWGKTYAQVCLDRLLCPCPSVEGILSLLAQAKQMSPHADGYCCAACPNVLLGFWSLRELEAEVDREEGRDETNRSGMESWKDKVGHRTSASTGTPVTPLSHPSPCSGVMVTSCWLPAQGRRQGQPPFPQLSSCTAESHVLFKSEFANSLPHFDSKCSQTGELQ